MSGFGYRTPGFGVNEAIVAAGVGLFESVEYVTVSMGAGQTVETEPLVTSVDATRSVPWFNYGILGCQRQTSTVNGADHCLVRVELIDDGDTLEVTREVSNQAMTITVPIVQFAVGKVESIQKGTISITAGNSSEPFELLASVTTSRSVPLFNGFTTTDTGSSDFPSGMMHFTLTDANTVTGTQDSSATLDTAKGNFVLIQFAVGVTVNVQAILGTIAASTSSKVEPITSVDIRDTILFPGGWIAPTTNYVGNVSSLDVVLTGIVGNDADELTYNRNSAGATANTMATTAVSFTPGEINSIQRLTGTMGNGQTQVDVTIPVAIDPTKAVVNVTGCQSNSGIGINTSREMFTAIIVDVGGIDKVRLNRGASAVMPVIDPLFEVVESA